MGHEGCHDCETCPRWPVWQRTNRHRVRTAYEDTHAPLRSTHPDGPVAQAMNVIKQALRVQRLAIEATSEGAIRRAGSAAYSICEECGGPAPHFSGGWRCTVYGCPVWRHRLTLPNEDTWPPGWSIADHIASHDRRMAIAKQKALAFPFPDYRPTAKPKETDQ